MASWSVDAGSVDGNVNHRKCTRKKRIRKSLGFTILVNDKKDEDEYQACDVNEVSRVKEDSEQSLDGDAEGEECVNKVGQLWEVNGESYT